MGFLGPSVSASVGTSLDCQSTFWALFRRRFSIVMYMRKQMTSTRASPSMAQVIANGMTYCGAHLSRKI